MWLRDLPVQSERDGYGRNRFLPKTSSLDRMLLAELAVGYLPYASQGEDRVHHLFPEVQLQAQWLGGGTLRPYLGVAAGAPWAGTTADWGPGGLQPPLSYGVTGTTVCGGA